MTYREAADKLAALAAIAGSGSGKTLRTVYLSPGDAEALRLAVDVLRREAEIVELDPWERT